MKVYQAINRVQSRMAKDGIGKNRQNTQQNYSFRGIDDVFNALAPVLADEKLCVLPRILKRDVSERVNAKGNTLFYVVVEAEFDFISSEDGSKHTVRTYGEAMDSGDKATNKAMSAAYKYAALMAFSIPTEGDNDADATTHTEVKAEPEPSADLLAKAKAAADAGTKAYADFWKAITAADRRSIGQSRHADFKAKASEVVPA